MPKIKAPKSAAQTHVSPFDLMASMIEDHQSCFGSFQKGNIVLQTFRSNIEQLVCYLPKNTLITKNYSKKIKQANEFVV